MRRSLLGAALFVVGISGTDTLAWTPVTVGASPLWIWTAGSGGETVITAGDNQRGLAFNPLTRNLYVGDRQSGGKIKVLDSLTGVQTGLLNTAGLSGGAVVLAKVGVSADGAIYATNVSLDGGSTSTPFKIYRWPSEADALINPPTVVFDTSTAGNSLRAGYRYGDNFDIRGGGNSTQILLGAGSSAQQPELAVLTWNGAGFDVDRGLIGNGAALGGSRLGVAFGEGNDAFSKGATPLLYSGYTTNPLAPSLVASTPTTVVPSGGYPMDYDPVNNFLAIIDTSAHDVRIFDVRDPNVALQPTDEIARRSFGTAITNLNGTGQVVFGDDALYVLDTNNAIAAYPLTLIPRPSASLANLGGMLQGDIGYGEVDWYAFDYSGVEGFTIDTIGSTFDTEIALFDSRGELLTYNDDAGGELTSLIYSPIGLSAGAYYLAIGGYYTGFDNGFIAYGGNSFGSYNIHGICLVPEPGWILGVGFLVLTALRGCRDRAPRVPAAL